MSMRPFLKSHRSDIVCFGLIVVVAVSACANIISSRAKPEQKQAYYNKCVTELTVDGPVTPEIMRECRENTIYFFGDRK